MLNTQETSTMPLKEIDEKIASRLIAKYNESISKVVQKLMVTPPEDIQSIYSLNSELQGLVMAKNSIEFRSTKNPEILQNYQFQLLFPSEK